MALGPTAAGLRATPPAGFRRLAPGSKLRSPRRSIRTTRSLITTSSSCSPRASCADLGWTPTYTSPTKTLQALATNRPFRSTTWYLEFIFKPLRVIHVDLPNDNGRSAAQDRLVHGLSSEEYRRPSQAVGKGGCRAGGLPTAPEVEAVNDIGAPIHFFPSSRWKRDRREEEGLSRQSHAAGRRGDPQSRRPEPAAAQFRRDRRPADQAQHGDRGQQRLGCRDLGRCRSAHRFFFDLRAPA